MKRVVLGNTDDVQLCLNSIEILFDDLCERVVDRITDDPEALTKMDDISNNIRKLRLLFQER